MRNKLAFLLFGLAVSVSCLAAPAYKSTADEQSALGIRVAGVLQAWSSPNFVTALRPFYSPTAEVIYDITPLQFHSVDEYIAYVAKSAQGLEYFKLAERGAPVMHITGPDSAWAAGIVTLTIKPKSSAPESSMAVRWTSIWQKEQGVWKIVHEHYSVPMAEAE